MLETGKTPADADVSDYVDVVSSVQPKTLVLKLPVHVTVGIPANVGASEPYHSRRKGTRKVNLAGYQLSGFREDHPGSYAF